MAVDADRVEKELTEVMNSVWFEERPFLLAEIIQPSGESVRRKLAQVFHTPVVTDDFRTS